MMVNSKVKELKKKEDNGPIWPVSSDSKEPNRRLYTTRSFKSKNIINNSSDKDRQLSAKESLPALKSVQNLAVKCVLEKKVSFKLEAAKATPALPMRKGPLSCPEDFALSNQKFNDSF